MFILLKLMFHDTIFSSTYNLTDLLALIILLLPIFPKKLLPSLVLNILNFKDLCSYMIYRPLELNAIRNQDRLEQ